MFETIKNRIKQQLTPKAKLVVLNYHQLGETFNPKLHNAHIWNSVPFFEEQMTYLKRHYTIVSLKDGVNALKTKTIKETLVCITFDDGDASVVNYAMPLLDRKNIPATFFINTAYGQEKTGYWYNLAPYYNDKALMEASETIRRTTDSDEYHKLLQLEDQCNSINKMNSSPFYANYKDFENCTNPLFHFGLHGHEHLRFSMLSRDQQKQNLERNIEEMQHWPNYVPYFAVPFGQPQDWNIDTLDVARELDVLPFLAYHGYNTRYRTPLLRFSVDTMDLDTVFKGFSPFQKTYDKLNAINH